MVKKIVIAAAAALALLMIGAPARAHHSANAEFDTQKEFTITGTLTKLENVNPHSWWYVDVRGRTSIPLRSSDSCVRSPSTARNTSSSSSKPNVGGESVSQNIRSLIGAACAMAVAIAVAPARPAAQQPAPATCRFAM